MLDGWARRVAADFITTRIITRSSTGFSTILRSMVRMTVLASGSRGNTAILSSSGTSILIDAGISCRETLRRMHSAGEDPAQLSAIVITHAHQDHISGLAVLA